MNKIVPRQVKRKINFNEGAGNTPPSKIKINKKPRKTPVAKEQGLDEDFVAEFNDNGRFMRMSLNTQNIQEGDYNAESDQDDNNPLNEENFVPDYDMEGSSDDEEYVPQIVNKKTHEEKIRELDEEMSEKIQELQSLIGATGGLTKSAALMKKFCVPGKANTLKSTKNRNNSVNKDCLAFYGNTNQNATGRYPLESRSEETIYKNALEKRTSSSSEDDCIDISDDSLYNIENFLENVPKQEVGEPPQQANHARGSRSRSRSQS